MNKPIQLQPRKQSDLSYNQNVFFFNQTLKNNDLTFRWLKVLFCKETIIILVERNESFLFFNISVKKYSNYRFDAKTIIPTNIELRNSNVIPSVDHIPTFELLSDWMTPQSIRMW